MRQWIKTTALFNPMWHVKSMPTDEWLVLIVGNKEETHFRCEGNRRGYSKALWTAEADSLGEAQRLCEQWLAMKEVMSA